MSLSVLGRCWNRNRSQATLGTYQDSHDLRPTRSTSLWKKGRFPVLENIEMLSEVSLPLRFLNPLCNWLLFIIWLLSTEWRAEEAFFGSFFFFSNKAIQKEILCILTYSVLHDALWCARKWGIILEIYQKNFNAKWARLFCFCYWCNIFSRLCSWNTNLW